MAHSILLVADAKKDPTGYLFKKIAGIPLLARNCLNLHKKGTQKIHLALSLDQEHRFQKEVAPYLIQKKDLKIEFFKPTPNDGKYPFELILPANSFIEEDLAPPFYQSILSKPVHIRMAEKRLLETIRQKTLGPIAKYLNKRISLPISLRLAKWGLHPNWVSFFNIVLGYSTGFFVAKGSYFSMLIGGFLFQMASVFDGCDGELAKLRFKANKFGEYLDSISDNGTLLSFFIGLIFSFSKTNAPETSIGLALLLLSGLSVLFWQIIHFLKKNTQSASLATFDREYLSKLPLQNKTFLMGFIRYGRILLRKDCFSFLFFLSAIFGILSWWITIAAIGIWIANGVLLWIKIKKPSSSILMGPLSTRWND